MQELLNFIFDLKKKYYKRGSYLYDVPEEIPIQGNYIKYYHYPSKINILKLTTDIELFDQKIEVLVHKPDGIQEKWEYENHFGFGGHCSNFNPEKLVIYCPSYPIFSIMEMHEKILNKYSQPNENLLKELWGFLILSGHINSRKEALKDLVDYFKMNGFVKDTINEKEVDEWFLFELGDLQKRYRWLNTTIESKTEEITDQEKNEKKQCPICYQEYTDVVKTPCDHIFCKNCISSWIETNHTCPCCRKSF